MADYLFLDDIRIPNEVGNYMFPVHLRTMYRINTWEIVRDYDQFVKYITENGLPNVISFDHDLADVHYDPATWTEGFKYHEKTGYDCAKWLVEYCMDNKLSLPPFYCHSMNPHGKKNILNLLENFSNNG